MANIKIISTFENAEDYIKAVEEHNENTQEAWQKYMIDPFWADITYGVNRDVSFMKPAPIQDINALKEQLKILSQLSIDELRSEFDRITTILPKDCDDQIFTALYPACDSDKGLKDRENGVRGNGPDGNVIININPLARGYHDWIPYIFAHEYHHGVWGYTQWRNGIGMDEGFYNGMIIEGQADLFAESIFPELIPQWNRPLSNETELWERVKTDSTIHEASMFGDETKGLPWCMGYSLGRAIVSDYMKNHPNKSFMDLTNTKLTDILNGSRFKF